MASTALILGGLAAAGSIGGGLIGASASKSAAQQQADSAQKALDYTKQVEAPFVNAGSTSIAKLMESLNNGTFGPGSLPAFQAPTAAEAEATPGYQFTKDQGTLGIERGAAAAGGAFTGGTLKSIDQFNTGLANSTYGDTFNRAMQSYQALLSKQGQEYQQLVTPATIGANAASGTSTNVANLMTQIGNSQAAGTVGAANATTGAIGGATNSLLQTYLFSQLNPSAINNPANIQNSVNAGKSAIADAGLPTGGTWNLPEVNIPG